MDTAAVDRLVEKVEAGIRRRRKELEEDLQTNVFLENRVVSDRLATVQGLQKHLSQSRLAKLSYEGQITENHSAHGTTTRAAYHRK